MGNMETGREESSTETPGTSDSPGKGRPPPIALTSDANLISFHRELNCVVNGEFFFRNIEIGTRITTKCMVDYIVI
jgi:hypothetical protein